MCLVLLAKDAHPRYRLIVAANRDEYYNRPSMPAHFWEDSPDLLGGRDLKAGGGWLGITKKGRLAAVTNFRDPGSVIKTSRSRGELVARYLASDVSPEEFATELIDRVHLYNPFNMILADRRSCLYFPSRKRSILPVEDGIHGLSNAYMDTPWPKVQWAKEEMKKSLCSNEPLLDDLFTILCNRSLYPDRSLPETGIGIEWERILSPVFVVAGDFYGTRCSTVITVDRQGEVFFTEKSYAPGEDGPVHTGTRAFGFRL